jgi:hypothetical protein
MIIQLIQNFTRILGKSQGYLGLPIFDHIEIDKTNGKPTNAMTSAWALGPDELERLNAGALVYLTVLGSGHPPVRIEVGEPPQ